MGWGACAVVSTSLGYTTGGSSSLKSPPRPPGAAEHVAPALGSHFPTGAAPQEKDCRSQLKYTGETPHLCAHLWLATRGRQ